MINRVVLVGRLTRDVEVRKTQSGLSVAQFTVACDRRGRSQDNAQQTADFISCVAFGRSAEFAEKYLRQGTKVVVTGRIQTGSYTNRDGQKVYTTDVVVEDQEFAESKAADYADRSGSNSGERHPGTRTRDAKSPVDESGFMNIPEGIDEELPFN